MSKKASDPVAPKKVVDVVHQDRNWVTRIHNQLDSGENWNQQWGYLTGGIKNLDETAQTNFSPSKNIDTRIEQLQKAIQQMNQKNFSTTNSTYGQGQKLQLFKNDKYHIHECKDLRALERRLPKNWTKKKWTPPDDPFDELKKLGKKK